MKRAIDARRWIVPIVLLAVAATAPGDVKEWDGEAGDNKWQSDDNWDPNGEPSSLDTANIGEEYGAIDILNYDGAEASILNAPGGLNVGNGELGIFDTANIGDVNASALFQFKPTGFGVNINFTGDNIFDRVTFGGGGVPESRFSNSGYSFLVGDPSNISWVSEADFRNTGTFELGARSELRLDDATFENVGTLQLRSTAGPSQTLISPHGVLGGTVDHQSGTILATGDGVSAITSLFNQSAGATLMCEDGTLQLSGGWTLTGGSVHVTGSGLIDLFNIQGQPRWVYDVSFIGEGTIRLANAPTLVRGASTANVNQGLSGGDGLKLQEGVRLELGGSLTNNALMTGDGVDIDIEAGSQLVNANAFIATGNNGVDLRLTGGEFINHGNFSQQCTFVGIGPGTFRNEADGTYSLDQIDGHIVKPSGQNAGVLENSGVIVRPDQNSGEPEFNITIPLNMKPGGVLRMLDRGRLDLNEGGAWTGGSIDVQTPAAEGSVRFLGHGRTYTFNGNVTFGGVGQVQAGAQNIAPTLEVQSGQLTLNLVPGGGLGAFLFDNGLLSGAGVVRNDASFTWSGGEVATSLVNEGTVAIDDSFSRLSGTLTNNAFVVQLAALRIDGGTVRNESRWDVSASNSHLIDTASGGLFINNGLLDVITPPSTITDVYVDFDNNGTVHAHTGSVRFLGEVVQLDEVNGRLLGGTWLAEENTEIRFPAVARRLVGPARLTGSLGYFPQVDLEEITDGGEVEITGDSSASGGVRCTGSSKIRLKGDVNLDVNGTTQLGDIDSVADVLQGIVVGADGPGGLPTLTTTLLDNHARLVPGPDAAPGGLRIVGDVLNHPTATIVIDLGGLTPVDEHDQIVVEGDITLDGTLDISVIDGFEPQVGQTFTVITATGSVSGTFDTVVCPTTFNVVYNAGDVTIVIADECSAGPSSFNVVFGALRSGDVSDLHTSDDQYVVVEQRAPFTPLLPAIRVEFEGAIEVETPTELMLTFEASASALPPNSLQRIEMFNDLSNRWDSMDERLATVSDQVVDIVVTDMPEQYVEPGTGAVRSRANWFDPGDVLFAAWVARIDQVLWTVTP